jgi:hypothetical protein
VPASAGCFTAALAITFAAIPPASAAARRGSDLHLPFQCPADFVFHLPHMDMRGLEGAYRVPGFLEDPRAPPALRLSRTELRVAAAPGGGGAPGELPLGASAAQLVAAEAGVHGASVLTLSGMRPGLVGGLASREDSEAFDALFANITDELVRPGGQGGTQYWPGMSGCRPLSFHPLSVLLHAWGRAAVHLQILPTPSLSPPVLVLCRGGQLRPRHLLVPASAAAGRWAAAGRPAGCCYAIWAPFIAEPQWGLNPQPGSPRLLPPSGPQAPRFSPPPPHRRLPGVAGTGAGGTVLVRRGPSGRERAGRRVLGLPQPSLPVLAQRNGGSHCGGAELSPRSESLDPVCHPWPYLSTLMLCSGDVTRER